MPVEIRELIIKTEIITEADKGASLNDNEVHLLKEELVEMCKRMLSEEIKKTSYRR